MELANAGRDDASLYNKRITYCQEFYDLFPESDHRTLLNMKRAIAESYFALNRPKEGEESFKKLIKEFPDSAWGYIGWGDMYWLCTSHDKTPVDYEKAERIYRMALKRNVDDKKDVKDRLKNLEKERNHKPEINNEQNPRHSIEVDDQNLPSKIKEKILTSSHMIQPTAFYSRESEKTKLNWFCYEFSRGIYNDIRKDAGQQLKKYGINENIIADFSIYLSKKTKDVILQKLSGKIDKVYFSYEMIESYFPNVNDKLTNQILNIISKTWDDLLDICETCPNRCISEKDTYCTMFDELANNEVYNMQQSMFDKKKKEKTTEWNEITMEKKDEEICPICMKQKGTRLCPDIHKNICPSCCGPRRSEKKCTNKYCKYGFEKTWKEDTVYGKVEHRISWSPTKEDIAAELNGELIAWCYKPLETLDGKKPIDVVKTPEGKKKLIELIHSMETKAKKTARPNAQPLDYTPIKKELGLL
jgi:tetratricopeptide (TPR) repeat protein